MSLSISQTAWDRQFDTPPLDAPRQRLFRRPAAVSLLALAAAGGGYAVLPLLCGPPAVPESVAPAPRTPSNAARERSASERARPTPALWKALRKAR